MSRLEVIYQDYSGCCSDFGMGIECLRQRALCAAIGYFRQACESVAADHPYQSVYQSFYGLARILNGEYAALDLCRESVSSAANDAELFYLLARAEMFCKNRRQMVLAIDQGMRINRQHPGLLLMRQKAGYRKFRPFPFLPRDNFLNQVTGRLLRKNKM